MKALSIRQPWAYLITTGIKPIENRSRRWSYRGPLLVHAGKTPDLEDVDWINHTLVGLGHDALPPVESLLRGGIVGRVQMVDCVQQSDSPWFFGPFGYLFESAEAFPFLHACKGQLGPFEVDLPLEPA